MRELRLERPEGSGARAARPVYRQIADELRARIERGEIAAGERLPPIRALARGLGVHRDTVGLAYEALAREGRVEARVGQGTFATPPRPAAGEGAEPAALALSPVVERLLDFERGRAHFRAPADTVPLHSLAPDPSLFPVAPFRRALERALDAGGAELLGYGGPPGLLALREALAARLSEVGSTVSPDEVVLCQGASQGIALALRLFASEGDAVAIEEPTYHNALAALAGLGLRAVPVPMEHDGTEGGPELGALERALARPEVKLLYTIPTFHNPLGVSAGLERRRALLRIAARCGKPVVEDAYEMDLRLAGRPVPPLAALDAEGRVVQLVSLSKSLFPGVRTGAVVARGRLVEALLALKHATDLGGAPPIQAALAEFLRSGAYDAHLGALRRTLRRRRDALLGALEAEMPEEVRFTRPEGGYQVWLELPEPLDAGDVHAEAMRAGVLVAPGAQFQADGRASRGLRLAIAVADEAAIERGVARLAKVVRERLASGRPAARAAQVHM